MTHTRPLLLLLLLLPCCAFVYRLALATRSTSSFFLMA
jgi:hypothetical protein